ncbi:hypothetical protein DFQ27_004981 [Actinomortierella ambigua]|uniref:Tafazzin family protein n=1 Tax=Actinomortierella ambigua TaxID=1343610 RepID=A0A9P6QJW7_9FUNG|nr:hypothetical protein DFQ27_004981 [Actinomortierella ambigua]
MGLSDRTPAQPQQPSFAGVPLPGIEVTGASPDPEHALTTPFPPIARSPDGQPAGHPSTTSTTTDGKPLQHGGLASSQHDQHQHQQPRKAFPRLPLVPPLDNNPNLEHDYGYRADPSSILLRYPRTLVSHTQDFCELYNPPKDSFFWNLASTAVIGGVGTVSKIFMTFGAYTSLYNMQPFLNILYDKTRTRPILTVTNHMSTADDPLLWGALPWKCYKHPSKTIRYALGAQELCYFNKPVAAFFRFGQVVPVIRGNGIFQPAVDYAIEMLKSGKWVHVFPEGKVNQQQDLIRLKWGVGRVLMEYAGTPIPQGGQPFMDEQMPIVIPIYHLGMEEILKENPDGTSPIWPKMGLPLTIVFGKPIDFGPLIQDYKNGKIPEVEARIQITSRVWDAMEELHQVALKLHREQTEKAEKDQREKGQWWWIKPVGWGWWRSKDIDW